MKLSLDGASSPSVTMFELVVSVRRSHRAPVSHHARPHSCTRDVMRARNYCPHDLMFIAHLRKELKPAVLDLMCPL